MIRNFKLNVLFRLLIISGFIFLLIYFILVDVRYLRAIYIGIFLILAIVEFLWYVERTNRDFNNFMLALMQDDFTTTFSTKNKGKSFNELYSTLNRITKKFEEISSDKEIQHLYLEAMVDHLRVGILSFDKNEKIHLMNTALQRLFDRPQMAFVNNLANIDPRIPDVLREIKPRENKVLKVTIGQDQLLLNLHASEFILGNDYFKLISIQNIKHELEANELEAWQKLIRVLTHEIMNSVTPITSLSGTLRQILESAPEKAATYEKVDQGLAAIQSRSSGLEGFTRAYRKLTKIPQPNFQEVNVNQLISRVLTLLEKDLSNRKVNSSIPENLVIVADPDLMDQVVINLIKNAIEATANKNPGIITIRAKQNEQTVIVIQDNGEGIDGDKIDQIFVPFFTTKKEGSGIGLALSRQIIQLHKGKIRVHSTPGEGTAFEVLL